MKILYGSSKLLVAAALVASGGAASALDIVQNGGFETGNFDGSGGIGIAGVTGVSSLPGGTAFIDNWAVTNGKLIWLENGYAGGTGSLSTPFGSRFLDMTALTNDATQYAKIEQTLNTTANTTYALTFSIGSSNDILKCGNSCGDTIVDVTAGSFSQSVNVGAPAAPNIWTTKTVFFTTASNVTNISLTFKGIKGDDYVGLDNVSVTAVPEPGAWAMLLAGLAAVGSVTTRRRARR